MKKITGMDLLVAAEKAFESQARVVRRLIWEESTKATEKLNKAAMEALATADEAINIGRTLLEKKEMRFPPTGRR
jgi:hypothetical protein